MINQDLGDLRISGSGSAGGGKYNKVSISGSGKIKGDLSCESFSISGSGKVDGTVTATSFKISGSGKVTKDLNCSKGSISGSGKIEGTVHGGIFTINGSGGIDGDFRGEEFVVNGAGRVQGKVNATNVKLRGQVEVVKGIEGEIINIQGGIKTNDMINGDEVNIEVRGSNEIGEIGATRVRVVKAMDNGNWVGKMIFSLFGKKDYGYLVVKTIEADEIYLENTIADVVRGGKIVIGEGCKIKRIEYSESFEKQSEDSVVEETIKL